MNETVPHILPQGLDIFRFKQVVQKCEPALRFRCCGVVANIQPVTAYLPFVRSELHIRRKHTIEQVNFVFIALKIRSVANALQCSGKCIDPLCEIFLHLFCKQLVRDHLPHSLNIYRAVGIVELPVNEFHRMFFKELVTKRYFIHIFSVVPNTSAFCLYAHYAVLSFKGVRIVYPLCNFGRILPNCFNLS